MRNRRSRHVPNRTGSILLANLEQVSLWENELTGQLSDGMWEDSGPWDHWQFWCRLNASVATSGEPRVESEWWCKCVKDAYAFERLYGVKDAAGNRVIMPRMLALGRMARAARALGMDKVPSRGASEYMPPTLEEWQRRKATGDWEHDFIARYMGEVTDEVARAFYAATYTEKELRADVKAIQAAMANRGTSR